MMVARRKAGKLILVGTVELRLVVLWLLAMIGKIKPPIVTPINGFCAHIAQCHLQKLIIQFFLGHNLALTFRAYLLKSVNHIVKLVGAWK
ncbi:hypothetical protein BJD16_06110 [Aeromonas sobria]|uniref:Uncharacterized protein n=1 Tax=Aeromonas sobria TaxID=646 RepID=A0A1S2CMJ3_AERSO|nr:hypothetical protein BJD16_06110 [Aeromonas sobria]